MLVLLALSTCPVSFDDFVAIGILLLRSIAELPLIAYFFGFIICPVC